MTDEILTKSPAERGKMRKAGRVVAKALRLVEEEAAIGVTTGALDAKVEKLIRDCGATPAFKGYRGFPASICTSINEEVVHGIPGERKLQDGDILSVDIGALLDGYYGDAAVSVPIGDVDSEGHELIETTKKALDSAVQAIRPGMKVSDISRAVQNCAETAGFGIVRKYTGHGIGSSMHEAPQIPNFVSNWPMREDPVLEVGAVVAIEPMLNCGTYKVKEQDDGWTVVTEDGSLSAHFEHTVSVEEHGPAIMTVA